MNWVTIIWSMAATVALALGAIHFVVWFQDRKAWANLRPLLLAGAGDINLRIMNIATQAGAGFTFPASTVHFERGQGHDETLSQQTEAEARRWREQGKLPQHKFTDMEIRELTGTLKYPDSGTTDGRMPDGPQPLGKV